MRPLQSRTVDQVHNVEALVVGWGIHTAQIGDEFRILDEGIEEKDLPSQIEINKIKEQIVKKEKDELYREYRKREYPSIGDQLDALFHAGVFPPEMAEKIQEIKDKYPKVIEE
jgi:hypothetical protein